MESVCLLRTVAEELELLRSWQQGDAAAGRTLVERHFKSVYRFFVNKVPSQAADLVQETFLACIEGQARFRGASSFRTYVFAIARRRLYRYWRDNKGDHATELSVAELVAQAGCPADALAIHQEQKLLLRGLRKLPLKTQILLELAYFEGFTDRELAELEDIPVGTLKSRLRKARATLADAMSTIASGALLESTTHDLDGWIRGIRERLAQRAPG